jgi:hypothetical protein
MSSLRSASASGTSCAGRYPRAAGSGPGPATGSPAPARRCRPSPARGHEHSRGPSHPGSRARPRPSAGRRRAPRVDRSRPPRVSRGGTGARPASGRCATHIRRVAPCPASRSNWRTAAAGDLVSEGDLAHANPRHSGKSSPLGGERLVPALGFGHPRSRRGERSCPWRCDRSFLPWRSRSRLAARRRAREP